MLRVLLTVPLLLVLFTAQFAAAMPGQLSGAIEYRYAQHTAEQAGTKVLDAQHFVQKYSVLWEAEGSIKNGRVGEYNLALGYEWNWIDTEVDGAKTDIDNPLDKILFRGDLLVAPKGLPFRLNLYSSDTRPPSYQYTELGELFSRDIDSTQRGIITSFRNGSHVTTGMTLLAGEKNGLAYGPYRDVLNSLPRLLVDFRQDEVRDVKSPDPVHYLDRNLAFVSLNKNKNWFHYRFFTHQDLLNPDDDYETQTYLLGTIDHVNRREWVDLTNWIRISSDLSYSEVSSAPGASQTPLERYDMNLFARVDRSHWRGSSYNSFSRVREENSLTKSLSTPIFANGEFSPDTAWRFRLESDREQQDRGLFAASEEDNNLYLSGRLETQRQSHYVVAPMLELEHREGDHGEGVALRGTVEAFTNPRLRGRTSDLLELFGSYSVSSFGGNAEDGSSVSYLEQSLEGRAEREVSAGLRTGVRQVFDLGSGRYDSSVSTHIRGKLTDFGSSAGAIDGTTMRSLTSVFVDHQSLSRLSNRYALSFDYVNSPIGTGSQIILSHDLNYYGDKFDIAWNNELVYGGALTTSWEQNLITRSSSDLSRQGGVVDGSASSRFRLNYDPDRVHHNRLNADVEWRFFENGGTDKRYYAQQQYQYNLWKNSGLIRRVAEFGEELEYDHYLADGASAVSLTRFTLFSNYYPTRNTLLGIKLRYEMDSQTESDTMLAFLSAGMTFAKFEVSLDYSYGVREESQLVAERTEHKWEMIVKKTF
ncbi:MAG TPA: hypothetical protein VIR78_05045 [Malonomonas sp.]